MESSFYESTFCIISLDDMKSIAKHSFLVHKSVTYLDLSLSEYASYKTEKHKLVPTERTLDNLILNKSNFVCTYEGAKKNLAKNRSLLYKYHLDVHTQLESSQKYVKKRNIFTDNYNGVLLNAAIIPLGLYRKRLHEMIIAVLVKTQEVKFVRGFLKVIKLFDLDEKSVFMKNICLEILYSQHADSDIAKEFSRIISLEESDIFFLKPKILDFFLQHSDCKDCNDPGFHRRQEWINCCIFSCKFEQVASLLMYYNAPRFSESAYIKIKKSLRIGSGLTFAEMEMPVIQGWTTKKRSLLILQTLDVYYCGVFPDFENSRLLTSGSEALRLLWSSIPDTLISLDELILLFGETRIARDVIQIHNFYSDIVGEKTSVPQPRRLQDYCRIAIRKVLTDNQLLPVGIGQLGLPPKLQSFLKLQPPGVCFGCVEKE